MRAHASRPGLIAVVSLSVLLSLGAVRAADAPPTLADAKAALAEGRFPDAEAAARALLGGLDAAGNGATPDAAAALDVLVEALWRGGKAQEPGTRALAERNLALKQKLAGPDSAGAGRSLNDLAVIAFYVGDYPRARSLWEQAIAAREKALGPDHPDVADSANGLANLYQTIADYNAALPLYRRALAIREKAYGPDHPRVGQSLNNLSALLTSMGDYAGALPLAERSLKVKEKTLGKDHPQLASSMTNLGWVLVETGDYPRARQMFEGASRIWAKALGPEHPDTGMALNNQAEELRREGQLEEARALYERALAILEKAYGPEHERVGIAVNSLGEVQLELRDLPRAKAYLTRAVAIREKVLGEASPDLAESTENLAELQLETGEYDAGRATFRRTLKILEGSVGPEHPWVAQASNGLATLEARAGARGPALDLALRSEGIGREHLRLTGRTFTEEQALRYAAVRTAGLDLALTLATAGPEPPARDAAGKVFDALVRSRAVVLDEMAARHHSVVASKDPAVARLAATLTAARARLANLTVRGIGQLEPEQYRALLDAAKADKEEAEAALAAASSAFARERELGRIGLADLQAALPAGAALVSYVVFREVDLARPAPPAAGGQAAPARAPVPTYAALVLRADRQGPAVLRLGAVADVDPLVARWKKEAAQGALSIRRTPEESEAAYRDVGTALRGAIWDPLAPALAGATRVFVVPDGALNLVSFAALPAGDRDYLVQSGPLVHYLSAERDLAAAALGAATPAGSGLLALGGPDYDNAAAPVPAAAAAAGPRTRGACSDFESMRFDPLPAASREADEIAALWDASAPGKGGALRLEAAAASEAAFKRAAPGRRVLHLATHGFFLGGDCSSGAGSRGLKLAAEPKKGIGVAGMSPLLLSGLALAGANRRAEAASGDDDGVLTAMEIAALDLTGVEWAVLSACDTGVGEVRTGEGVFGLRRAMQVAGVRTLVMSLWPVDDESTRAFMNALYAGRLRRGLDTSEAAREAARSVLAARKKDGESTHPFYWGAFVAAGQWR